MAGVQVLPNGKDMNTNGMLTKLIEDIKESNVNYNVGPMETVIEGDMQEVMELIIKLQGKAVNLGAEEVITNVKFHYCPKGVNIGEKTL